MYSIGEISKMFQLPISTLRYYDKEGLFPHLKRVNGVRQFSEIEIETLRVIDCLKRSGLEIKDIKEYIALCSLGNATLKQRKAIFEKQKEEVLQEMEKLKKFFLCSIINVGIMIKLLKKMMKLMFKHFHSINFHHKSNNTINIVMKIIRSEKENTHYFINYFDSLYSGFGFYVNDYYHAQTDALEILKHQEVKQVNSNLITLSP